MIKGPKALHNDKGTIQQEDITKNIYPLIMGEPKYIKQKLADVKREIDGNKIVVQDFNTPQNNGEIRQEENQ